MLNSRTQLEALLSRAAVLCVSKRLNCYARNGVINLASEHL
jgi:hypothetical protein